MPYNFNANMHTYGNRQTHSHIAHTPAWFFPVRVLQAILALVTLALSAFVIDTIGSDAYDFYGWNGTGLNIWTSILTWIFLTYVFLTAFKFATLYNNWAVLGGEIACAIFWLITFSLLAAHAKEANDLKKVGGRFMPTKTKNAINSLTAAAVLGALNYCLFVLTVCFFGISLHRHRTAGHPFTPGGVGSTGGNHKMQNVNPATGTEQQYGGAGVGSQPADQQYPSATYNQPAYNQQGHQAV